MTAIRPWCPGCGAHLGKPEAITALTKSKVWCHVTDAGTIEEDKHQVVSTRGNRLCANCGRRLNTFLNQHRLAVMQGIEEPE